VHPIFETVRARQLELIVKNFPLVLRKRAELIICVLKLELSQAHFVHTLFAQLTRQRDPGYSGFFGDFLVVIEFLGTESQIVHVDQNEFAVDPPRDLCVSLTRSSESRTVTLCEKQDEATSFG